jgi:DinB family protein
MDARDLFLQQHAAVHSAAVGGNKMSLADRTFAGLTDAQMRVRPREDLNSLAWLMFHISRTEDIFVNGLLTGQTQVFDDWSKRLGISRRDFGFGMSSAEVNDITQQVDVAALREYRDAVGRRTQEIVSGFKPQDWQGVIEAPAVERAAADGSLGRAAEAFSKNMPGRPRAAVLSGIALLHSAGHMGEAVTVRTAGGFGTGM